MCAAVAKSKLKKGESVFRRNGPILAVRWFDKRAVTMLSTIHEATEILVKTNYRGDDIIKPLVVHEYTQKMGVVDLSDRFLATYNFLQKGFKWYRKLLIHLFSMVITNSFVLNKKFGRQKLTHYAFREHIAEYLISSGLPNATCTPKRIVKAIVHNESRLQERHFPTKLQCQETSKRSVPCRACICCNFSEQQLKKYGHNGPSLKKRFTSYSCVQCRDVALCITPCYKLYHTELKYREKALTHRLMLE